MQDLKPRDGSRVLKVASLTVVLIFHSMLLALLASILLLAAVGHRVKVDEVWGPVIICLYTAILISWFLLLLYLSRLWRRRDQLDSWKLLGRWLLLFIPIYGAIRFKRKWYPLI